MAAPDISPAPYYRGDPAMSMARPVSHGQPVAGGVDYVEPTVKPCGGIKADGARCGGFSSGEDGLCAGHRRQRIAREGS